MSENEKPTSSLLEAVMPVMTGHKSDTGPSSSDVSGSSPPKNWWFDDQGNRQEGEGGEGLIPANLLKKLPEKLPHITEKLPHITEKLPHVPIPIVGQRPRRGSESEEAGSPLAGSPLAEKAAKFQYPEKPNPHMPQPNIYRSFDFAD